APASTSSASETGRSYHRLTSSVGLDVRPYTRPRSSSSGRGLAARLIAMVTAKHVTQAAMAVQNVCASSLGYVVTTPRYPPFTPTAAPAGSESPGPITAANVAATTPENAPRPVARRQHI